MGSIKFFLILSTVLLVSCGGGSGPASVLDNNAIEESTPEDSTPEDNTPEDSTPEDSAPETILSSTGFISKIDQPLESLVVSNTVTVSTGDAPVSVSIENGEYAVNGGDYTSEPGSVMDGDSIILRTTTGKMFSQTSTVYFYFGNDSASFTLETLADTEKPQLSVAFPYINNTLVYDRSVFVNLRGEVSDNDVVDSVTALDTVASINRLENLWDLNTFLEPRDGLFDLEVQATDLSGNSISQSVNFVADNSKATVGHVGIDAKNNRAFYESSSMLTTLDLNSGDLSNIKIMASPSRADSFSSLIYNNLNEQLYGYAYDEFYSIDLQTGVSIPVSEKLSNSIEFPIHLANISMDEENNILYVLNREYDGDKWNVGIYSVNLSSGTRDTILQTTSQSDIPFSHNTFISFSIDTLYIYGNALDEGVAVPALYTYDTNGGLEQKSFISRADDQTQLPNAFGITADKESSMLYLAVDSLIYSLDLNTGKYHDGFISNYVQVNNNALAISQQPELIRHPNQNQILVSQSSPTNHIIAIDIPSGDHKQLTPNTRGNGPALMEIIELTSGSSGQNLFAIGQNSGSGEHMKTAYQIDIASGNRKILASPTVGEGTNIHSVHGAGYANGKLFWGNWNEGLISYIDIDTQKRESLAPQFGVIAGLLVSQERQQVFVFDSSQHALFSIDLSSNDNELTLISKDNDLGGGELFDTNDYERVSMQLSRDQSAIYVGFGIQKIVFKIMLETGDRSIVAQYSGLGDSLFDVGQGFYIDDQNQILWIPKRNSMERHNLIDGSNSIVYIDGYSDNIDHLTLDSLSGRVFLGEGSNAISEIDLKSEFSVGISK